ncbi:hypothetical protein C8J57DRAFT_1238498 [Mycena rebaudengoi]|nr:hypothetical protein C8J57DRAFT_1238498 [Mycena rebaudengoi]
MNSFYDQTAATLKKDYCVGPAHMVDIDNITAKELGFLKAQKATMKDCAGDPREITFTVVGMLLDMDIPPNRLNTRNIPFFLQHATIVGLGTEKFEKAMDKIAQVAVEVELAFEDNNVEPWTPSGGADELGDTLQTSCRFFTLSKEAPTVQIVVFDKHVDPAGVLTNTLAKGIFHCVDNEVSYMNMEGGRLVPKNPSAFRIGDIVELGFSVVAFKGSQEARAVVKLVMRSLIFLDGSHTRAERLRYKESRSSKKRTVDRDDISEEEETRQRGPIVFGNTNDGADISIQIG